MYQWQISKAPTAEVSGSPKIKLGTPSIKPQSGRGDQKKAITKNTRRFEKEIRYE